jgi:hypothetical protein
MDSSILKCRCGRFLSTIATMLTGTCERCELVDPRDARLYPYWRLVDPERVPLVQRTLFCEASNG